MRKVADETAQAVQVVTTPKAPRKVVEGEPANQKPYFRIRRADQIEKREMEWLWQKYIPRGVLTMLTGDPGCGKSTIIVDVAARLSRGIGLPEEEKPTRKVERTWIMSAEDSAEHIITWRLENQGADMSQIYITDIKTQLTGPGLKHLHKMIVAMEVQLVVIDTATTWLSEDVNMNAANEVMSWLNPLKEIAHETGCTFVLIRHRRKGAASDNKIYSGLGSIGWTAAVRSELSAFKNKKGVNVLDKSKGNVGAPPPPLAYSIVDTDQPGNPHGTLVWEGVIDPAEIQISPGVSRTSKGKVLRQAIDFIVAELNPGPQPAKDMFEKAEKAGISEKTLRRAKEGIVDVIKMGKEWMWSLNKDAAAVVQMGDPAGGFSCNDE